MSLFCVLGALKFVCRFFSFAKSVAAFFLNRKCIAHATLAYLTLPFVNMTVSLFSLYFFSSFLLFVKKILAFTDGGVVLDSFLIGLPGLNVEIWFSALIDKTEITNRMSL